MVLNFVHSKLCKYAVIITLSIACTISGCGNQTGAPTKDESSERLFLDIVADTATLERPVATLPTANEWPGGPTESSPLGTASNLLVNGEFEHWPIEDRLPLAWSHGVGYIEQEMPSVVERATEDTENRRNRVTQTWRTNDTLESLARAFGQTVTGLGPNTRYELEIRAYNQSENLVGVSVWETEGFIPGQPDTGQPVNRLELNAVEVTPGDGFGVYRGSFLTKSNGVVRIAAKIEGKNPVLPGTVIWDYWKLTRYRRALPNLIRNGDFSLWPDGTPWPQHWLIVNSESKVRANYSIEKVSGSNLSGGHGLLQVWQDERDPGVAHGSLGFVAIALKPDTTHKLSVRARNESDTVVLISAWDVLDYTPDVPDSVVIGDQLNSFELRVPRSDEFETYSKSFQTGNTGLVLFCTTLENTDPAAYPISVLWDSWTLNRDEGRSGSA